MAMCWSARPAAAEATLVALDKKSGDVVWKSALPEADQAAYASIIVVEIGGVKQYVQFLQKGLVGVAADPGKLLWRYAKTAEGSPANIPTPIAHDGMIYSAAGRSGGGLVRLKLEGDGISAEQVYFIPKMPNSIGGAVLLEGYLYGTNTQGLMCVDFATGEVKWQERGVRAGSVLLRRRPLYVHGEKDEVALVEPSATAIAKRAASRCPISPTAGDPRPGPIRSSPTAACTFAIFSRSGVTTFAPTAAASKSTALRLWHDPDIPISHRVAVILQIDRSRLGPFGQRSGRGRLGQLHVVLNDHAVVLDRDRGVLRPSCRRRNGPP